MSTQLLDVPDSKDRYLSFVTDHSLCSTDIGAKSSGEMTFRDHLMLQLSGLVVRAAMEDGGSLDVDRIADTSVRLTDALVKRYNKALAPAPPPPS